MNDNEPVIVENKYPVSETSGWKLIEYDVTLWSIIGDKSIENGVGDIIDTIP